MYILPSFDILRHSEWQSINEKITKKMCCCTSEQHATSICALPCRQWQQTKLTYIHMHEQCSRKDSEEASLASFMHIK